MENENFFKKFLAEGNNKGTNNKNKNNKNNKHNNETKELIQNIEKNIKIISENTGRNNLGNAQLELQRFINTISSFQKQNRSLNHVKTQEKLRKILAKLDKAAKKAKEIKEENKNENKNYLKNILEEPKKEAENEEKNVIGAELENIRQKINVNEEPKNNKGFEPIANLGEKIKAARELEVNRNKLFKNIESIQVEKKLDEKRMRGLVGQLYNYIVSVNQSFEMEPEKQVQYINELVARLNANRDFRTNLNQFLSGEANNGNKKAEVSRNVLDEADKLKNKIEKFNKINRNSANKQLLEYIDKVGKMKNNSNVKTVNLNRNAVLNTNVKAPNNKNKSNIKTVKLNNNANIEGNVSISNLLGEENKKNVVPNNKPKNNTNKSLLGQITDLI